MVVGSGGRRGGEGGPFLFVVLFDILGSWVDGAGGEGGRGRRRKGGGGRGWGN
jgi:hypothetical protein